MKEKNMYTRKTNEEFIADAYLIHKDRYDYSLLDYKSNITKIKIICKKHGVFEQTPKNHLRGAGCIKCNSVGKSKYKKEEVIEKLESIYGENYEYPDFTFNSLDDEIKLVCKKHGDVVKKIKQHLKYGCKKCYYEVVGSTLRTTIDDFIKRANEKHSFKYDYSNVVIIPKNNQVEIICRKHGSFFQDRKSHLGGNGCPTCSTSRGEILIENFLKENNINYQSQFQFSDCRYINPLRFDFYLHDYNICIEFDGVQHYAKDASESYYYDETVKIRDEIKTNYCKNNKIKLIRIKYHSIKNIDSILTKILKKENVLSMEKKKEFFIKKAIELWGYKYDYSRVDYVDYKTPVKIGYKGLWYSQTPNKHLQGKKIECQESRMSTDNFIILSKNVWGDRFVYTECEYLGNNFKVKLFDTLKGKWIEQIPKTHLKGFEVTKLTKEDFFDECNLIYENKYTYNLENYKNLHSQVNINCVEHGKFELKAATHLYGTGCTKCDEYKFNKICKKFFKEYNLNHLQQHKFEECKNNYQLPFDFYIPSKRTCIEFDGIQHFQPIEHFGGIKAYEQLKQNDKIKNDYCEENYINLIRVRYDQIDKIEEILRRNLLTNS
jgi:very-short-patch-repair endonuclease